MLRELETILNKNVDAMYKADEAMKTGMGVVKNYTDKTADFPAAETAEGIFFTNKERIPTGTNAGVGDMSDYDTNFVDIAADEFLKLITPLAGEVYGTDQYVSTGLAIGDAVSVNTAGKFIKASVAVADPATPAVASRFIYAGTHSDNGKTLAKIAVSATTKVNLAG